MVDPGQVYGQPGYYQDWQAAGVARGNGQAPLLSRPEAIRLYEINLATYHEVARRRERSMWLFAAGSLIVVGVLFAILLPARMGSAAADIEAKIAQAKSAEDEAQAAEAASARAKRESDLQISSIDSELSKARAADENAFSIQVLSDRLQEAKAEAAKESDKRAAHVKGLKDEAAKAKAAVVDSRRSLDLSVFLVCGCLALVVGVPMCRAWKRALAQSRSDRHAAHKAIRQLESDYALQYSPLGEAPKPDQKAEEAAVRREQFSPKTLGLLYWAVFLWVVWPVAWDWGAAMINKVSSLNLPGPYG